MKTSILYFPYISLPSSAWTTQMLLYWDQVSSIVPSEYVAAPESLEPFMRDLVEEELVRQVLPGDYFRQWPGLGDPFLSYVRDLDEQLAHRRAAFTNGQTCRIHIEKVGSIADALIDLHLARLDSWPWYVIEHDTADDFMAYLATTLGQVEGVNAAAMTDNQPYLNRTICAGLPAARIHAQLDVVRTQVLDQVLPVPTHTVRPSELRRFKERYPTELRDLRIRVERELVTAANIDDADLRSRQLSVFAAEAEARIADIEAAMRGTGWRVVRSTLSLAAAIPGVAPVLGLLSAVAEASGDSGERQAAREFAYAAYARREL